jgi:hypothetical protein
VGAELNRLFDIGGPGRASDQVNGPGKAFFFSSKFLPQILDVFYQAFCR